MTEQAQDARDWLADYHAGQLLEGNLELAWLTYFNACVKAGAKLPPTISYPKTEAAAGAEEADTKSARRREAWRFTGQFAVWVLALYGLLYIVDGVFKLVFS